jgi:FkbM family methyltransferase
MSIFGKWPEREVQRLAPGERVWIFGAGGFGRAVARACASQGIEVRGFVQTQPTAACVDGLPVCTWGDLKSADRAEALLIGIFNRDTPIGSLVRLASEAGCQRIVLPWDLHAQFGIELGWRYWLADSDLLRRHATDLERCFNLLSDEKSRECLKRLVDFRLGLNMDYSEFTHKDQQYFNSLSLSSLKGKSVNYIDGGAYNGDSFLKLLSASPVQQAWLFEPDTSNFSKLTQTVRNGSHPGYCLPLALSDKYRLLRFSSGLGEAGHIDQNGDEFIAAVSIDDFLAGQAISFIKLDVEGAEESALRGAKKTIAVHRPVLALSCYHNPQDLWALPDLICELAANYRFYLRQHMFNSFELVLYAIPDEIH